MGSLPIWRVPSPLALHWREWDSEFIVYHEQSGDTHRLNAVGAASLRLLTLTPLTEAQLLTALSTDLSLTPDPALAHTIHDLLGQLSDLGLIDVVHDAPEPDSSGTR